VVDIFLMLSFIEKLSLILFSIEHRIPIHRVHGYTNNSLLICTVQEVTHLISSLRRKLHPCIFVRVELAYRSIYFLSRLTYRCTFVLAGAYVRDILLVTFYGVGICWTPNHHLCRPTCREGQKGFSMVYCGAYDRTTTCTVREKR
jgi:hypothetical protein